MFTPSPPPAHLVLSLHHSIGSVPDTPAILTMHIYLKQSIVLLISCPRLTMDICFMQQNHQMGSSKNWLNKWTSYTESALKRAQFYTVSALHNKSKRAYSFRIRQNCQIHPNSPASMVWRCRLCSPSRRRHWPAEKMWPNPLHTAQSTATHSCTVHSQSPPQ